MIAIDFALAVVNILLKKSLQEGMNHLVFITYRLITSSIFLAPIGYFWERYICLCACVGPLISFPRFGSFYFYLQNSRNYMLFRNLTFKINDTMKYFNSKAILVHYCRDGRPRLTFRILCYLFLSAIVGLVIICNTQVFFCNLISLLSISSSLFYFSLIVVCVCEF